MQYRRREERGGGEDFLFVSFPFFLPSVYFSFFPSFIVFLTLGRHLKNANPYKDKEELKKMFVDWKKDSENEKEKWNPHQLGSNSSSSSRWRGSSGSSSSS